VYPLLNLIGAVVYVAFGVGIQVTAPLR
jgi:hypothetical protein